MKIFKIIISIPLWILWWLNAAILIVLLITVSLVIPNKYYDLPVHIVCRLLSYSVLLFPRLRGYEVEKLPYPVIFVPNHVSFFDLFISGTVLPGNPRGLELKEHFNKPIYGWFIARFGEIPIDPKSARSIKESFERAAEILHSKRRNILVMPEGTRTRDGKVKKFKSGAFYLARRANVPVVPVVYKNLYTRNNVNSLIINPGIVDTVLLPPVYPSEFETDDQMALHVQSLIENELES